MVKEIAVYINEFEEVTDISDIGVIKIFSRANNEWMIARDLPFKFHSTIERENIRLDTFNIAEALGSCRIFVAKELSDLVYAMLDGMGLSVWKMHGRPRDFLDYIAEKENEEEEEIKLIDSSIFGDRKLNIEPVEVGKNGYYIFNIKELQEHNIGITTKQALKPFLNVGKFKELIITCNHIPGWLESYLKELNLKFEFLKMSEDDYIIVVNKR